MKAALVAALKQKLSTPSKPLPAGLDTDLAGIYLPKTNYTPHQYENAAAVWGEVATMVVGPKFAKAAGRLAVKSMQLAADTKDRVARFIDRSRTANVIARTAIRPLLSVDNELRAQHNPAWQEADRHWQAFQSMLDGTNDAPQSVGYWTELDANPHPQIAPANVPQAGGWDTAPTQPLPQVNPRELVHN